MVDAFTPEQTQEAEVVRSQIQSYIAANRDHQADLESNYVEIGDRLVAVKTARYWRLWQFKNFSAFMESLDSRTKNYHSMGVARDLLPVVTKADLVVMGISKAALLRKMIKGGKPISAELVEMAKSKTKEELEGAVAVELGLVANEEKGDWFSFGGARLDTAEREEFLRTMNTVIRSAEIEGEEITNWQDTPSSRKKELLFLLFAEFLSTYAVYAQEQTPSPPSAGGDEERPAFPDLSQ